MTNTYLDKHRSYLKLYFPKEMKQFEVSMDQGEEASLTFCDLVKIFLENNPEANDQVEYDKKGIPVRLYPFPDRQVYLDPRYNFGSPSLTVSGHKTESLVSRFKEGESILSIIEDFGINLSQMEAVLRYELNR